MKPTRATSTARDGSRSKVRSATNRPISWVNDIGILLVSASRRLARLSTNWSVSATRRRGGRRVRPPDDVFEPFMPDSLGVVRVYTKAPGRPPDHTHPFALQRGQTVEDVARLVHKDLARTLRYARLWGHAGFWRVLNDSGPIGAALKSNVWSFAALVRRTSEDDSRHCGTCHPGGRSRRTQSRRVDDDGPDLRRPIGDRPR
jgi:TGS domain